MTLNSPERLISSWCPERGLPDENITHCFRKTSKFGAVPSHSPPRAGLWLALLFCGHPTLGRSTASLHGQKPVHTQEHSYPMAHLASLVLQVRRTRRHRPRVREHGQLVSQRSVPRAALAMRPFLLQEPAQGSRRAAFARDDMAGRACLLLHRGSERRILCRRCSHGLARCGLPRSCHADRDESTPAARARARPVSRGEAVEVRFFWPCRREHAISPHSLYCIVM